MNPQPNKGKPAKLMIVQTPMGMIHVKLPHFPGGGPDPVAVAMEMFQGAVDGGSVDPLGETLSRLKQMADGGTIEPLQVGLLILKQMVEGGLLPPMAELLEGTGITEGDMAAAENPAAKSGPERPRKSIFERMEDINQN